MLKRTRSIVSSRYFLVMSRLSRDCREVRGSATFETLVGKARVAKEPDRLSEHVGHDFRIRPVPPYHVRWADPEDRELVARFNERIAGAGIEYQFPLDVRLPGQPENGEGGPAFRKLLLIEDEDDMRGGVVMHHTTVFVRGEERPFCWSFLQISEG